MIKVNLLPQQEGAGGRRKGGRKSGPAPGAGGVAVALSLVLAYMVVIIVGVYVFYGKYQSDQDVKKAQDRQKTVQADIDRLEKEYKDLKTIKALYENQLEVLNALDPPNRLLWCEKLNLVPQLVPEGVFLTRVNVEEDVKEVETADSLRKRREWEQGGRQGPKPPVVKKPVIKQTLTLEGIIYVEGSQADKKRLQLYIDFFQNLRTKEAMIPFTQKPKAFMEHFEGEEVNEPIVGDTVAGREVSRFTIKLRTRPL